MPANTDVPHYSAAVSSLGNLIASSAQVLNGAADDYDALLALIGDARFVLLGESSHGTHEFYRERARITQRLIVEKGFSGVAVEADWPDAYRVNRYVRQLAGEPGDVTAKEALSGFTRFPSWLWRNTEVAVFVEWLRLYNDSRSGRQSKAGFYGLDLYSLFTSMEEVLKYLDAVDPGAARRARDRYACFDHFNRDSQSYGYAAGLRLSQSCEQTVLAQLTDLNARAPAYLRDDDPYALDALFYAQQNARLVIHAEEYYRSMFRGRVSSWNLRDRHMAETLAALDRHLSYVEAQPAKLVVWAHNSHIGDARATEIGQQGELNLGQLARQQYGKQAALVGFSTYTGSVTAASDWDAPAEYKHVRPALAESYEEALHAAGISRFMLPLGAQDALRTALSQRRLERAIGVIYRPETERQSHYFYASLAHQFDAILHFDVTRAVKPLETVSVLSSGEAPETFPVGI